MDDLLVNVIKKMDEEVKCQKQKRMKYVQELICNLDLLNISSIKQIAFNEKEILNLQMDNIKIIKRRMESVAAYPLLGEHMLPRLSNESKILANCIISQDYDASIFETALFFQRLPENQLFIALAIDERLRNLNSKDEVLDKFVTDSNNNLKVIQTGTQKILSKTK